MYDSQNYGGSSPLSAVLVVWCVGMRLNHKGNLIAWPLCGVFVGLLAISVVHAALLTHVDDVPRSSHAWFRSESNRRYSLTLNDKRRRYWPLPVNNPGVQCCRFGDSWGYAMVLFYKWRKYSGPSIIQAIWGEGWSELPRSPDHLD
jgi:hypothetical protein